MQTEKGVNALNEAYTSPSVIHAVSPSYPFEAEQRGIEGKVTVQFAQQKRSGTRLGKGRGS